MSEPSFSICIPNYNYERFVGRAIESALAQTYSRYEIVVVDNASTDRSVDVISSFPRDRVRLVRNRYNIGFAPNLHRATAEARNEYIYVLYADDLMKPDALAEYAAILKGQGERASRTVLCSDVEMIDGEDKVKGQITCDPMLLEDWPLLPCASPGNGRPVTEDRVRRYRGRDVLRARLRDLTTFAQAQSLVYPRVMWQAVEGYNCVRTIGPDKFFNFKLLALDPEVIYVRAPLFCYREHGSPNQLAQQVTLKQQIDDYLYTIEYDERFLNELGLSRSDLIRSLLDRVCLKAGLTQLAYGTYAHAFRMLAFALASYPRQTLSRPRAYALAGLLLLGPLASRVARPAYHAYRRWRAPVGAA